MKLGRAIIVAITLACDFPLVTRSVEDFVGIPGLQVVNPFTA
jgi:hypothetical protein